MKVPGAFGELHTSLQAAGYCTACIGKWGLGGPGSTGEPNVQGFDHFFGDLCQRQAHNDYPTHLWKDGECVDLPGNVWKNEMGAVYSPDWMDADAVDWIGADSDEPLFLLWTFAVPHLALQVPDDSLAEYVGKWDDPAYDGKRGYLPHEHPRAAYAAMITRMDRDIGRQLDRLEELGARDNTLVIFTSDNGATYDIGGAHSEFFESNGYLRGAKGRVYGGGLRVPMVARLPGACRRHRRAARPCGREPRPRGGDDHADDGRARAVGRLPAAGDRHGAEVGSYFSLGLGLGLPVRLPVFLPVCLTMGLSASINALAVPPLPPVSSLKLVR